MELRKVLALFAAFAFLAGLVYLSWPREAAGGPSTGSKWFSERFDKPVMVHIGDRSVPQVGMDVWIPNPYLDKHNEAALEGRLAIPSDGMELFEHGYFDGGDMDKSENEQYIAGSGRRGANWAGLIDLWSPEGLRDNWSVPKSTLSSVVHDPARAVRQEGRIEHGFVFENPVLHSLFDLVIQENPIFSNFSPTSNAVDSRQFRFPVFDIEDDDGDKDEVLLGEQVENIPN